MRQSKNLITAIILCMFAFAGTTYAVGQLTSSPPVETGPPVQPEPNRPVPPSVSDKHESIGILRRARTAGDNLPSEALEKLRVHGTLMGENLGLAHKAYTTKSGLTYYVVPANDSVCLNDEVGRSFCTSVVEINAGHFIGVELCAPKLAAGQFRVSGMLPDQASDVQVTYSGGRTAPISVDNNVYSFETPTTRDLPSTVDWTLNGMRQHTAVDPPADVDRGCGPVR